MSEATFMPDMRRRAPVHRCVFCKRTDAVLAGQHKGSWLRGSPRRRRSRWQRRSETTTGASGTSAVASKERVAWREPSEDGRAYAEAVVDDAQISATARASLESRWPRHSTPSNGR
jgi:hypothetical protein